MAPKAQVSGAQRFLFRSKYDSSYATFTPTLAYLWYLVPSLHRQGIQAHILKLLSTYVRKIRQHKKSTRSPHPALFIGRVFIVVHNIERPNNKNEARILIFRPTLQHHSPNAKNRRRHTKAHCRSTRVASTTANSQ